MFKKIFFVLMIALLFFLGLKLSLKAQRTSEEEGEYSDFSKELNRIETKIDRLSLTLEKSQKEVLEKLARVLSGQEKILNELEVVKVRASRR